MKKSLGTALILMLLAPLAPSQTGSGLPDRHKRWLDEEVVYIIAPREREVFLRLQTDRERDIFIEAFWKHRDPYPETPRNEFREEHYSRLEHANAFYGRSTPLPGWKTDRGRIYILLGPPRNIEQYDNVKGVCPTEIWFYLGDPAVGLPTAFNVIFFKRESGGDYVLYSPANDGPRSLIADSMGGYRDSSRGSGSLNNDRAAYKALKELEPNLAPQILSLIPGESVSLGYESLASVKLIATIFSSPVKKVETDYADAILKFKDFVEVEYTANYISSEVESRVIRDTAGEYLVHYTIEPDKISVEESGGKYEARFDLTGRVSDASGKTVYQFEKNFPFSLTAAELEDARAKSISIQDAFPLIAGSYDFDILLKNVLSKEFTGANRKIVVPGKDAAIRMSPLILAYGLQDKASPQGERVPFKVGKNQLLVQTHKTFSAKDPLVLYFELSGLGAEVRLFGTLLYTFYREDKEFLSRTEKIEGDDAGTSVISVQPLAEFTPGYYQAKVSLLDRQGKELASTKENFEVSPVASVPRPFVIAKVTPAVKPEDDLLARGIQYANMGNIDEARVRLAAAQARDPRRRDLAVAYARALFRSNDFKKVREVLLPFADEPEPAAEVLGIIGQACHALEDYREASKYYSAYLSRYGANVEILNFLGTCHFKLGNKDEAVRAWTKSLEINPDQEKIRDLLETLKKK